MRYQEIITNGYMQTVKEIGAMESELQDLPKGNIIARERRDKTYYYLSFFAEKHFSKYLRSSEAETVIQQVRRREVLKAALKERLRDREYYERALRICGLNAQEILEKEQQKSLREERQLAAQQRERDLAKAKPFGEKYSVPTLKGEYVQSKSEMMIANSLAKERIPYQYEQPLQLQAVTLHPDFTIQHAGKTMYWEHCGMMDNTLYAEKWNRKLKLYQQNGIVPGETLILTYETSKAALSQQQIDYAIYAYLKS